MSNGFLVVCSEAKYMKYLDCEFKDLAYEVCNDKVLRPFVVRAVNDDYEGNEEWYDDWYRNPDKRDVMNLAARYTVVPEIKFYKRKDLETGVLE